MVATVDTVATMVVTVDTMAATVGTIIHPCMLPTSASVSILDTILIMGTDIIPILTGPTTVDIMVGITVDTAGITDTAVTTAGTADTTAEDIRRFKNHTLPITVDMAAATAAQKHILGQERIVVVQEPIVAPGPIAVLDRLQFEEDNPA